MIITNKENLKHETWQALMNTSSIIAFVAMQEINAKTHYEFKKFNEIYDKLENLWDYLDFCNDNDINADISDYEYNLVNTMSDVDVKDYKTFYKEHGEFSLLSSI